MKRQLILAAAFLAGSAATLSAARARLQPEQHVYPDSTLQEIQQAIDTGGTVYFEYLAKGTGQPADYNQIMSSTPGQPPSPTNPPKGFNIGKFGKDVNILGVLGSRGERPRINGGTFPFRVGAFAPLGFTGQPVSFRIENLELNNPDVGGPPLYARIGIWVLNAAGSQSTIHNCKITIVGKVTDTGVGNNHSVGIWFYLGTADIGTGAPQRPPSGARIDITNNTVTGTKVHEAIHVNSFWQETPDFTAPRAFVSNNSVEVTNLGGYANHLGTDGATLATAIVLAGNLPDSIVANNTIRGDGRSPGLTPKVEAVGIGLEPANSAGDTLDNVTVIANDLSQFTGDFQIWADAVTTDARVTLNSFGPAATAGVMCRGDGSWFVGNHFSGSYPGWAAPNVGPGLFWFTDKSTNNRVAATMLNQPWSHFDLCDQVRDDSRGANILLGAPPCPVH